MYALALNPGIMDRSGFESLLNPIAGMAYAYAAKLTGNQDDAIDLVQDAAVQAYRGFGGFEAGTNFKAWFFRILTNKFYKDRSRSVRRGIHLPLEDAEDFYLHTQAQAAGVQDPSEQVLDRIDSEAAQAAIDVLPEEFRVVALLYFLNDFSYEQIAEVLEVPIGTVRSRLHRARKLLQRALWDVAQERGIVAEAVAEGQHV